MKNKYYDKKDYENDEPYCYYLFSINWFPENIIDIDDNNGYIVQKIIFDNTTGIEINREKSNHLEYFEAWKVENRKVLKYDKYDDYFKCGNEFDKLECLKKSINKKGIIRYDAQVYWVGESNSLYKIVDKWKEENISMAGNLKSIKCDECKDFEDIKPIFKRPIFIHKVDFVDEKVIEKSIYDIYNNWEDKNACIEMLKDEFFDIKLLYRIVEKIEKSNKE